MNTGEKMVLKDYGKTKFFQNPLQLTERQSEGMHR